MIKNYIGLIAYGITAILWTCFAVKMNTIIWNEKKLGKIIAFNFLATPIAMWLWIIGGSEVVRKRLQVAKDIVEIKQRKKLERLRKEKAHVER